MVEEVKDINIQEYQARLAAAKDTNEFLAVIAEIAKQKQAIAKAQAAALQKEAEALAKVREALAEKLHTQVLKAIPSLADQLGKVKAKGFTFKVDMPDANGVTVNYKSVELLVPTVKARKAGGGGGGTGISTSDETGLSLQELFDQYANAEEKAEVAAVDTQADLTDKAKNSKKWQVKTKAKKRILADNPNLIKK